MVKVLITNNSFLKFQMFIFLPFLGFDGGMNQTFHIIVKESATNIVKYDNSNLEKVLNQLDFDIKTITTIIHIGGAVSLKI